MQSVASDVTLNSSAKSRQKRVWQWQMHRFAQWHITRVICHWYNVFYVTDLHFW